MSRGLSPFCQRLHFRSRSSVLRRVRAKGISVGPPPVGLSEQEALTKLLRCQDLYALQPRHLADYDLDLLRDTKGGVAE